MSTPEWPGGQGWDPPPGSPPPPYGQYPQGQAYPGQPYPQQYGQPALSNPYAQPTPYGRPNPYNRPGYPPYGAPQDPGTNGMAIGSLACSVGGVLTCGLSAIVGVVLGHVALGQIQQSNQGGQGLALAGVIVGYSVIALAILGWVLVAVGA